MQAIILAGGFGTRLKDVVKDVPKPMAPVGSKPFLAHLLDYLLNFGVTDAVISVHYLKEQIEDYFKDSYRGMKIKYAEEETPLGTGGAILNSLQFCKKDKPVLVFNGDTFLKIDLKTMYEEHIERESKLSIALRMVDDCSRYGEVVVEGSVIKDFSHVGDQGEGYINAGIYIISPGLFDDYTLNNSFSFERDFLYQYVPQIKPNAFFADDYFIDIGVPEDYERACNELPAIIG